MKIKSELRERYRFKKYYETQQAAYRKTGFAITVIGEYSYSGTIERIKELEELLKSL